MGRGGDGPRERYKRGSVNPILLNRVLMKPLVKSLLNCFILLVMPAVTRAAIVTQVNAGVYISGGYFLEADGSLWTLGYISTIGYNNTYSQALYSNVSAIATNPRNDHTLLLKSDGSLWAFGGNGFGELGDGTTGSGTNAPELIVSSNVTAIAVGEYHSLFLKSDGSLWAMGDNSNGQLGDGTTTSRSKPEKIVTTNVTAIAAGAFHSLFLKSDGSLWAMGWNRDGELGDGTFGDSHVPEQIISSNVTLIAAEEDDSLFVKPDGSLWGMGDNYWGQLGNGGGNVPFQIVSSNVTAIAGGQFHTLFLMSNGWTSDGSLWAMGDNWAGQLGDGTLIDTRDGTTINRSGPEEIISSSVKAISGGGNCSMFLKSDGSLWAMGLESYNGNCFTLTPQQVAPLILLNGNFDSGDFLGWSKTGNFSSCAVDTNSLYAHLGIYGAELGPNGSPGFLSQTLSTTPGASYLLSFWLDSPDGGNPNEFRVSWNGTTLFDQTNIAAIGWTNIQLLVTATATNTVLQFGFRDDVTWLGLDDVRVIPAQPAIASAGFSGRNLVFDGGNGLSGRSYYTLESTIAVGSLNRWTPLATNSLSADGNFTITATNALNPAASQGFYRLMLSP